MALDINAYKRPWGGLLQIDAIKRRRSQMLHADVLKRANVQGESKAKLFIALHTNENINAQKVAVEKIAVAKLIDYWTRVYNEAEKIAVDKVKVEKVKVLRSAPLSFFSVAIDTEELTGTDEVVDESATHSPNVNV